MQAIRQRDKVDRRAFLQEVISRGGMRDRHEGRRAVTAVLPVLSEQLSGRLRTRVGAHLVAPWRQLFESPSGREALSVDELIRRVADREGVPPGFGLEHAQAVCQALVHHLPDHLRRNLRADVPRDVWNRICKPTRRAGSAPDRTNLDPAPPGGTLASGRAGSLRPVSEARPGQSGSILIASDPHSSTKLSGSPGPAGQRERKTTGP